MCGGVYHTRPLHSSGYEKEAIQRVINQLMPLKRITCPPLPTLKQEENRMELAPGFGLRQ